MDGAVRRHGLQAIPWMGQTAHAVWERLLRALSRGRLVNASKKPDGYYSGQQPE